MKKKLLSIILLMVVSFMAFNINAYADVPMIVECDVQLTAEIAGVTSDLGANKFHITRLTDNEGNVFYSPFNSKLAYLLNTIPDIEWDGEEISLKNKFDNSICPERVTFNALYNKFDFYGTKKTTSVISIDKPRYVIYEMISPEREKKCKVIKENGNEELYGVACKRLIIAEGYNSNGAFAVVGPDLESFAIDEVVNHQLNLIKKDGIGIDYFKIDEKAGALIGNNYTADELYDDLYEKYADFVDYDDYQIKILYASKGIGRQYLAEIVSRWLSRNEGQLAGYNAITDVIKDEDFVDECTNIGKSIKEGKEYAINKNNVLNTLTKLDEAQKALDEAYSIEFTDCGTGYKTSVTSSVTSCIVYSNTLGINEIIDLAYKENDEYMMNHGFIVDALYNDVSDSLKAVLEINNNNKINIIDAASSLNVYTEKFYTVIAYLRSKANESNSELDEYKNQINNIYNNYKEMVERHELNIYPVVDCETLLGEDLINKINSYLNIFKIAVPILLIGLGIVDFTKAVFAGEEDMKKAQKAFIKRLFIALLIFLIPTVVNLILYLANKVWPIISTDSCGLY